MQRAWRACLAVVLAAGAQMGTLAQHAKGRPASASVAEPDEDGGLSFRLSDGQPEGQSGELLPPAVAEALPEDVTRRLLERLPALTDDAAPTSDFALRDASLPPPRAGRELRVPFPPEQTTAQAAPAGDAAALEVLRHAPHGDVPLAPNVSVTFSRPMVPVTGIDDLASHDVPVRLRPTPAGRWRWLGTRTLVFESDGHLPMATDYDVEVPAGTRGQQGEPLKAALRWRFSTPPAALTLAYPRDAPARRDTLLFAAFDQRVTPKDVLAALDARAAGRPIALRLAEPEEYEANEMVRALVRAAQPGRFVVARPTEPLPADSAISVTVGAGTPSAEGPRRTAEAQSWSFRTFGPLRLTGHACGWGGLCRPFVPLTLQFSNPLDRRAFQREWVRIEPDLPGARVQVNHDSLIVSGATRGQTTYRVSVAGELRDVFGQTLGEPQTRSFDVGPAEPSFTWQGGNFIVLDPGARARLSVYTLRHRALRLRVNAVAAADYAAFQAHLRGAGTRGWSALPGRLVINTTVTVAGPPDELVETRLDLRAAFPNGLGHAIVTAEPVDQPKDEWRRQRLLAWVQSTRIGLSAATDDETLVAWATSLRDGQALEGVELALQPGTLRATSDAEGMARFALDEQGAGLLVARLGSDVALLPEASSWWNQEGAWRRRPSGDALAFYVIDDRGLYKPGEEVRVKGFVRRVGQGLGGDVTAADDVRRLLYTLRDAQGNQVAQGETPVGALGGFELTLTLPATMNLGAALLTLDTPLAGLSGGQHVKTIQVQEFRRPEFEVSANASVGPHFVGSSAELTVTAAYYAGGALPGAAVSWNVSAHPASYTPPGRSDFTFGEWVPWWKQSWRPEAPPRSQTFEARTDAGGRHVLRVDFDDARPPRPTTVAAEATVTDVNRQAWTARTQVLVHPARLYVGLRSARLFVQRGEPLVVESVVTDVDGRAVAGRAVTVRAERLEWEDDGERWREVPRDARECELVSSADVASCTFDTPAGGAYRVSARVSDEEGRSSQSALRLWVAGGDLPPRRALTRDEVELLPDRKEYRAGDTAEVLVLAPFAPAEGLLTLRRSGLVRTQRFRMSGRSHTLRVPIEERFTPNVTLHVELVGAAPRDAQGASDATRPAHASGALDLAVPPYARTLALTAQARESRLEPGGTTTIDLDLRDAQGRPVNGGEVAVIVADEAVLALSGYKLDDPLAVFYPTRAAGVRDEHLRDRVLLGAPDDVGAGADGAPGGAGAPLRMARPAPQAAKMRAPSSAAAAPPEADLAALAEPSSEPIRTRLDFSALALFAGALVTDAQGRAQVTLKLPDNLTRYRVMAVAAAGARQFGLGESTLSARLPLMVRPSAPRFLNFGDRFELPVVVQNQTDAPLVVDVAVRAANATLTAGAGRRVHVPANERVEVRFPTSAAAAGRARFQVAAVSGRFADAADVSLPVWTPATTEAFATYGHIDAGHVSQPVRAPRGAVAAFGGLEVTTSSTTLQALTDALLYLTSYPYECSEQIASRVLAVAALRDVLQAFQTEGLPTSKELEAGLARDVERLRAMQNDDGSFGFWRQGGEPWPWLGVHVAHAFERARAKGFAVPEDALERSRAYLRGVEGRIPKWYGDDARHTLLAYALDVRARLGDADAGRARRLAREVGIPKLSFEALAFLLPTLAADNGSRAEAEALRRHLANRVTETAATAHFAVDFGDDGYLLLHSDRRADALVLAALIGDQPQSDLIPKLVAGLLASRRAGRWQSTQENVFVLLALDRYFNAYEKVSPDFVARLWLGARYAGEQSFRGRSSERRTLRVPMAHLAAQGRETPLVLAKDGPGRLYYRIGLRYAPAQLDLAALDAGFTVGRRYEAVDHPDDVRRGTDGVWHVRAGSRVRVVLSLVAPSRRAHVALVDPLAAGLEAVNPSLATSATPPPGPATEVSLRGAPGGGAPGRPGLSWWFWTRPWFEHQNLRDERVEAFASLLFEGVYSYSYVARATTPGAFVVPPAKAEEMYAPETFGRSASDRLIVD